MLVLLRKTNESIIIGGGDSGFPKITVMVTKIEINPPAGSSPQVKIGIEAPRDISVHRKEIQDKIDQNSPP